MAAYYNEVDPYAAAWLRNLIAAGHIAPGDVDERSIVDVRPDDLRRYEQCHFFAGIGGWSLAARLAGWPDDRPLWTGSCPCQPFSAAGRRGGFDDERHLWPVFFRLIAECRPCVVMGEQVASKDGLHWLGAVFADLEGEGYLADAVDLCAAGVGAPHIRQRLWWIGERLEHATGDGRGERRPEPGGWGVVSGRGAGGLGVADDAGLEGQRSGYPAEGGRVGEVRPVAAAGEPCGLGHAECWGPQSRHVREDEPARGVVEAIKHGRLADAAGGQLPQSGRRPEERDGLGPDGADDPASAGRPGPSDVDWRAADWLWCRDGKWRPVEPGTFPLADGVSGRVGRLRAYGNAIVPQVAAEVIAAFMEVRP